MRVWTDEFCTPRSGFVSTESFARLRDLLFRRGVLYQYELESYAAVGRMVCDALEQGTRKYVDLGHDTVARFVRVIEVTTPAYPELSE